MGGQLQARPRGVLAGRALRGRPRTGTRAARRRPDRLETDAREIRVHVGGELRVVYVATLPEAVYVLHVFEKKTRKTSPRDLALGQQRYQSMMQGRRTS